MIPSNPLIYSIDLTNKFLVAPLQAPDNRSVTSELIDYELGGIALQDTAGGLRYQVWRGWWDEIDSTAYLAPDDDSSSPIAIFVQPGVVEFTFTFDQNMRWSAATRTADDTLHHRWYDSAVEAYVTTTYPGVTSVRLALDDKRDTQVQLGAPDMILTYVRSNQVRWRIQRDRFLTEYSHSLAISDQHRITHFGMNKLNRLQWRIGLRRRI